jgi:hypothetical protein
LSAAAIVVVTHIAAPLFCRCFHFAVFTLSPPFYKVEQPPQPMCVAEEKMAGGSSSVAHRKAALGTSTGWLASVDKVGMGMEMVVVHVSGWGASS